MRRFTLKYLFPVFLLIILLDLNEFVTRFTGSEAILTNLILILSVALWLSCKKYSKRSFRPNAFFLFFLFSFISLGSINTIFYQGIGHLYGELRYYLPTIIIYLVSYRVISSLRNMDELTNIIHSIVMLIGVNAVLILISIFFKYDFHEQGVMDVDRAVGLYSNANRAGYVSAIGQALSIYMLIANHSKKRNQFMLLYVITMIAAFSTFSKGASIVTLILAIHFIYYLSRNQRESWIQYRKYARRVVLFLLVGGLTLIIYFERFQSNLSTEQANRLNQLEQLFQGTINDETTTHRSEIGAYAWSLIQSEWVLGYGLGTFRQMDIGNGTHNIYLLIWGESGVIAIILYICFLIVWYISAIKIKDSIYRMLMVNILIIFIISGFVAHTLLVNKPYIIVLGVLMGGARLSMALSSQTKNQPQIKSRKIELAFETRV